MPGEVILERNSISSFDYIQVFTRRWRYVAESTLQQELNGLVRVDPKMEMAPKLVKLGGYHRLKTWGVQTTLPIESRPSKRH